MFFFRRLLPARRALLLAFLIHVQGFSLQAETLKIVAFSDINGSNGSTDYVPSVGIGLGNFLRKNPALVIGVGDYTGGEDISLKLPDSIFPKMWDVFIEKFFNPIVNAGVSIALSPGNHDASGYPRLARERQAFLSYWSGRKPALNYVDDQFYPLFYSYEINGVFFISMDDVTPVNLMQGALQRSWIAEQLSSSRAKRAKARIVYGHIPLYAVLDKKKHANGNNGKYFEVLTNEQFANRGDGLESILIAHKVDLAVFAHSHAYYAGAAIHNKNGKKSSLRILSMPCLGPGARFLPNRDARSPNGYALIEVDLENSDVTYEMYTYDDKIIAKTSLPESIVQADEKMKYVRDDLRGRF